MTPAPVRGQIWEYVQGSRQFRVLIISGDEYNELPDATPWALTIERGGGAPDITGYLIRLGDDDPLAGAVVLIPRVLRCSTSALRRQLGFVSHSTMEAVERGLREFLGLP